MIDYHKLTDFQINKRVLKLKSGLKPLSYAHDADKRSAGVTDINGIYHWYDFCNDWADAGPIIQRNRIMLNPYCADGLWKAEHPVSDDGFMKTYAVSYDKNPLRAAMIAFLIMKEKANG